MIVDDYAHWLAMYGSDLSDGPVVSAARGTGARPEQGDRATRPGRVSTTRAALEHQTPRRSIRLLFAVAGAFSFDVVLFNVLRITNSHVLHHHQDAQSTLSIAAMIFGGIIGWGCGR